MTNSPGSGPVVFLMCPGMLLLLEKQIVSAAPLESGASYTPATCPVSTCPTLLDPCCTTFPHGFSGPLGRTQVDPLASLALFLTSPPLTDGPPPDGLLTHHFCHGKFPNMSKVFCPISCLTKNKCPTICSRDSHFHKCCNLNNVECILNLFPSKRCRSISIFRRERDFEEANHTKYEEGPKQESGVLQKSEFKGLQSYNFSMSNSWLCVKVSYL